MNIDPLYFVLAYFGCVAFVMAFLRGASILNDRYDRTST